jgi:superfamily II DNA or RNA helicase
LLAELLQPHCPNVITLVGSDSTKEKRQKMKQLQSIPPSEPLIIVATGKYIGEGFDYARLDTLFLASPVAWKGIVAQYAGRLHREHEGKQEVQIYDYIDIRVPVCESMYRKRLKGYASIGYRIRNDEVFDRLFPTTDVIYGGQNFEQPFISDLSQCRQSVVISSPKVKLGRYSQISQRLIDMAVNGKKIVLYTRDKNVLLFPLPFFWPGKSLFIPCTSVIPSCAEKSNTSSSNDMKLCTSILLKSSLICHSPTALL